MKKHDLKIWPVHFESVVNGKKRFELRLNDREYKEGDLITLREWEPKTETYTGRAFRGRVTFVLEGPRTGLAWGFCILGFEDLPYQTSVMVRE